MPKLTIINNESNNYGVTLTDNNEILAMDDFYTLTLIGTNFMRTPFDTDTSEDTSEDTRITAFSIDGILNDIYAIGHHDLINYGYIKLDGYHYDVRPHLKKFIVSVSENELSEIYFTNKEELINYYCCGYYSDNSRDRYVLNYAIEISKDDEIKKERRYGSIGVRAKIDNKT